ncbi:MAG: filamentous hemagglutinin N-terminal domain-containing protein [Nitrosomonas sp.]|nr:filamentous hemagglutinin N-terminal domain-containing protein [Nitrosomonas sp.]
MKTPIQLSKVIFQIVVVVGITFQATGIRALNTQILTDNTLSGVSTISIPGVDHVYTLSEINGKTVGNNLFYSFSNFNIGATDTAWFNLNTPDLVNVISRVTGGVESIIDGRLQMTNVGSAPSFFFINPAGITFGAGASVDVPGSFYTSTASGLNMSDGSVYAANEAQASTLSAAEPESFGFLGNEAGSINISGLETDLVELAFKPGTDVMFAGNNLQIENAVIKNIDNTLSGLSLLLFATGYESTHIALKVLPDQSASGNLTIQNAMIDASGHGTGYLGIRAGDFFITRLSTLNVENTGGGALLSNPAIDVYTNSLLLDNAFFISGVSGTGKGGSINIEVTDSLKLQGIGAILSATFAQGDSGDISITADKLEITGSNSLNSYPVISSIAASNTGNAGKINIIVNSLALMDGGQIYSSSFSQGNAGEIVISADQIEIIGSGLPDDIITGIASETRENSTGDAGKVTVIAGNMLTLKGGGQISANSFAQGKAGEINIFAKNLTVNGLGLTNVATSIASQAREGSSTDAGQVTVTVTDKLTLSGGGQINSGTFSQGKAGAVHVSAGHIEINGQGIVTGISSQAERGTGDAGQVLVIATNMLELKGGGQISSSSFSQGKAGEIVISADQIKINGLDLPNIATGIASQAATKSTNNAGNITVTASDTIQILNGGQIGSDTFAQGNAGKVNVVAQHIEINGGNSLNDTLTGISSQAQPDSSGGAGQVTVSAMDRLELLGGGQISSSVLKQTQGNAGEVTVTANQIVIDGQGLSKNNTGILSAAASSSGGNAGKVTVIAYDTLNLLAEGEIGSSTFSEGKAGEVIVSARQLELDNSTISSGALGSNGEAGSISITTTDDIQLHNQAFITTLSLATRTDSNANRGNITILLENGSLYLDSSTINTASVIGNGGAININAKHIIYLLNSPITTSVFGLAGNGGDINISANNLIMHSGFIQANTAASGASGGNVNINVPTLIPSDSFLQTGGDTPFDFQPFSGINVIQAAAPDGISGTITAATPQLNLSGVLTNLVIESIDSNTFNHNMCAVEKGSSLYQSGKGGMRMRARDFLLLPVY